MNKTSKNGDVMNNSNHPQINEILKRKNFLRNFEKLEEKCWDQHRERMEAIMNQGEEYIIDEGQLGKLFIISQEILVKRITELKKKRELIIKRNNY